MTLKQIRFNLLYQTIVSRNPSHSFSLSRYPKSSPGKKSQSQRFKEFADLNLPQGESLSKGRVRTSCGSDFEPDLNVFSTNLLFNCSQIAFEPDSNPARNSPPPTGESRVRASCDLPSRFTNPDSIIPLPDSRFSSLVISCSFHSLGGVELESNRAVTPLIVC